MKLDDHLLPPVGILLMIGASVTGSVEAGLAAVSSWRRLGGWSGKA